MSKRRVFFALITVTILVSLLAFLFFYHSRRGYIKITTDFPNIQHSINGREIDIEFELINGRYESTQQLGLGRKKFKASTNSGEIIKYEEVLIKDGETVEINIEVERGSLRDYLLEGE